MNTQVMLTAGIIAMPVVGVLAIVVIAVSQPDKDNTVLFGTIIGFIGLTITSLLNFAATTKAAELAAAGVQASKINTQKINEVHSLVNGQSEKLARVIGDEAFARGEKSAEDAAGVVAGKVAAGMATAEATRAKTKLE